MARVLGAALSSLKVIGLLISENKLFEGFCFSFYAKYGYGGHLGHMT